MLDLQPRVHLEEVEPAPSPGALEQELDRAGVAIADARAPRRPPPAPMAARSAGVSAGDGLSSIDLLMPALDRALALEQVDDVAVRVGEHLDLDVARPLDEALDVERAVAERRHAPRAAPPGSLASRRSSSAHDAHALAAAAGRRLDQRPG